VPLLSQPKHVGRMLRDEHVCLVVLAVRGVHELGGGAARAVGAVTEAVGVGDERTRGVAVEVGEREAAIDSSSPETDLPCAAAIYASVFPLSSWVRSSSSVSSR
jgi:hypothetical protein